MCCRWMGSHFHNWIDYNGATSYPGNEFDNGVAFSAMELPESGRTFSDFWSNTVLHSECLYCMSKVKCSSFNIR